MSNAKKAKTTRRIWSEELKKNSKDMLGVHLLSELVNLALYLSIGNGWYAKDNLENLVFDSNAAFNLDPDLRKYYWSTYGNHGNQKTEAQMECIEKLKEALILLAAEAVKDRPEVGVYYDGYGSLAIVGEMKQIEDLYAEEIAEGYYTRG